MKTKFSAIVSLRKKDMQECERIIMQNENKIASKKMQIDEIADELVALQMPQKGAFDVFRAYNEMKRMLLLAMHNVQQELDELLKEKRVLQEQYKKHHMEYEKMSFLDKKEQEAMIKALKIQEKRETDEIAIMLYGNPESRAV
ncbi:flagellar export protein FliJ [uncultured Helicobacter sp.]|uniref:flagellar export protein FliJ n=2 Tax=uncultured Helicobacter sp. TaxID=175537 RepID=UPI0025D3131C|nr:flagellar export protein FliJ [uncultured Helicobacter sp.]